MTTVTKRTAKPLSNAAKCIKAATLETKYKVQIAQLLFEVFEVQMSSGNVEQLDLRKAALVSEINTTKAWEYKSLDAIYKKGFNVTYAPNVISVLRYFTGLELSDADRAEYMGGGYKAIYNLVQEQRAEAKSAAPANDAQIQADEKVSNREPTEKEVDATGESKDKITIEVPSAAHMKVIKLLMLVDNPVILAELQRSLAAVTSHEKVAA